MFCISAALNPPRTPAFLTKGEANAEKSWKYKEPTVRMGAETEGLASLPSSLCNTGMLPSVTV